MFHNRNGTQVDLDVFDYSYKYFDLEQGGGIHPSILVSFAKSQLGIDTEGYMGLFEPEASTDDSDFPAKVVEE